MSSAASLLEPASSDLSLEVLDDCRVVAALGQGGMAEVFLATYPHQAGEDLVVIKRLHPHLDEDRAVVAMFLDEARVALRLNHPQIVRTYELGLFQGRHALVMEYLEGQPIQRVVAKAAELECPLPCEVVAPLIADLLDGLHYAHEATTDDGTSLGLVHRDVSPHNLFWTSDGSLKLLDFGIAKTAFQECRTRTGLLKGKVSYMAPEQAWGHRIDRRADLWSVGVVLWEMLAGRRLFKAENEAASLHNTLTAAVPRLRSVRDDVPPELERIVSRALQRDPTERFPSAAAMAEELRNWAGPHGALVRSAARTLFGELFGEELSKQRRRIGDRLTRLDNAPISGSIPIQRLDQPTNAGTRGAATNLSSTIEFAKRVTSSRAEYARWALLVLGSFALGALAFDRLARPLPPQPLETIAPAPLSFQATPDPHPFVPKSELARTAPAALTPEPTAVPTQEPTSKAGAPRGSHGATRAAPRRETPEAPPTTASERSAPARAAVGPAPSSSDSAASGEFGYLTIDSSPWSNVSVGGTSLGQTPIVRAKLPSGTHTLVLTNPDQNLKTSYQIRIAPGKTTVRRVGLE